MPTLVLLAHAHRAPDPLTNNTSKFEESKARSAVFSYRTEFSREVIPELFSPNTTLYGLKLLQPMGLTTF